MIIPIMLIIIIVIIIAVVSDIFIIIIDIIVIIVIAIALAIRPLFLLSSSGYLYLLLCLRIDLCQYVEARLTFAYILGLTHPAFDRRAHRHHQFRFALLVINSSTTSSVAVFSPNVHLIIIARLPWRRSFFFDLQLIHVISTSKAELLLLLFYLRDSSLWETLCLFFLLTLFFNFEFFDSFSKYLKLVF